MGLSQVPEAVGFSTTSITWNPKTQANTSLTATVSIPAGNYSYSLSPANNSVTIGSVTLPGGTDLSNAGYFTLSSATSTVSIENGGLDWNLAGLGTEAQIAESMFGNGTFVVGTKQGSFFYSRDGASWFSSNVGSMGQGPTAMGFGGGTYIVSGNCNPGGVTLTSTNAVSWTTRNTVQRETIAYGNGIFVSGGSDGLIQTSTDGITWTTRTSFFGTTTVNNIGFGNNLFLAVGNGGVLRTSTDGITWTSRVSPYGGFNLTAVGFGNGTYVLCGQDGFLATSTDGINWTTRNSRFGTQIRAITYGNNFFIIGGENSSTYCTSTDGITWTSRTIDAGSQIRTLSYGDNMFFMGCGPDSSTGTNIGYSLIDQLSSITLVPITLTQAGS